MPVTDTRGPKTLLVAGFLGAIYALGMVQAGLELRTGARPQALDLLRQVPTAANFRAFERELESESRIGRRLRPYVQYVLYRAFQDTGEKAIVGRDGWWFYKPGVQYLTEPLDDAVGGTVEADVLSAIVSFHGQLAGRGIRLLVVAVPGKASIYPDQLTARADPRPLGATHTQRLIHELTHAGVEVVNLFDAFALGRAERGRNDAVAYYLARDTHWTPAGVRLAAETIASRIRQLGWATPGTVVYDTQPVELERRGDVVGMLQSPPLERLFEPEQIRCEQVVRRDSGELYHDGPDAEILILGDSFLRMYQRDEPGSAGLIAHLARELSQPLSSIVNDGGASTLVRQELARKPELLAGKRLVIWEFVERDIRFGLNGWQEVPLP